jgi:hypothetical protein
MSAICEKCGMDFEKLDLKIYVKPLNEKGAIDKNEVLLFCPACGDQKGVDLGAYGFFFWEGQFYRWRNATAKGAFDKDKRYFDVKVGSLTLNFPGELIADDKFTEDKICYAAVPVFSQLEGAPSIPFLPVKKRYLGLVDLESGVTSERTVKGAYRFRFKLSVLNVPSEIVRPAVVARTGSANSDAAEYFDGVHLVLWPRIDFKDWRRYFLRFGCDEKYLSNLVNPSRNLNVWAYASADLNRSAADKQWISLDTVSEDGRTRYSCVESRPEWLAIEVEDKGRSEIDGGIWRVAPVSNSYPGPQPVTIGIDFGTSNTCVAWPSASGLELLPITDCNEFIIHGAKLPDVLRSVDTWVPRQGFGKLKALLPTEILTREKLSDLRSHARSIQTWRPVVDYSMPSAGVEIGYKEQDHVIADFKWQNMVSDPELQLYFKDIQKRYLEFTLLVAMAELASDKNKALKASLHIKFSYPLAFSDEMRTDFQQVLRDTVESVTQQTGVKVGYDQEMVDEARAAAKTADLPGNQDAACLYVDIGGGSTDIALLKLATEERDLHRYMYVCSFQYAGGGLVSALAKGGCLIPGSDIANFRRKVREVGSVKELMNSESVFLTRKKNAIEAKGSYFYAYLRQFLARLLAAHVISGEWRGRGPLVESTVEGGRPIYRIVFYTLGNGWGFGGFIDTQYPTRFSESLAVEVNQIIDEAIKREVIPATSPTIAIQCSQVKNPKGAVAEGTIKDELPGRAVKVEEWKARTILGWTTQVGQSRSVPWFREVIEGSSSPPPGETPIPSNATLNCAQDEWPSFPSDLPPPDELDEGLRATRQFLLQCAPSAIGKKWFVDSPFHVLMEKLFKPKLEELS